MELEVINSEIFLISFFILPKTEAIAPILLVMIYYFSSPYSETLCMEFLYKTYLLVLLLLGYILLDVKLESNVASTIKLYSS